MSFQKTANKLKSQDLRRGAAQLTSATLLKEGVLPVSAVVVSLQMKNKGKVSSYQGFVRKGNLLSVHILAVAEGWGKFYFLVACMKHPLVVRKSCKF